MITLEEYRQRRLSLAAQMAPGSVALLPAAREVLRNGDTHFRFRQDSDFYYLTGFNEPDALMCLYATGETILFNQESDATLKQWTGARLGPKQATTILGVDSAYPNTDINTRLPELLADKHAIYYPIGRDKHLEKTLFTAWNKVKGYARRGVHAPEAFFDLTPIIGEMRVIKSDAEIMLMRNAARISVDAHLQAMQACKNLTHEYELEAILTQEFIRQGCKSTAYNSIVAGGENSCILHYTDNNQTLIQGQLVLIDAAGEFANYAADITRTYPINGIFSKEQSLIYDLVLRAQRAGIACIAPGILWNEVQRTIVRVLTEGLVALDLLQGSIDDLIANNAYKPFYMHNSGHWLGLDVHDSGSYTSAGLSRPLERNMTLTVEPGLYISTGIAGIDPKWYGIGVRIEDDIRVTHNGHENLTARLPVALDELEALVRG